METLTRQPTDLHKTEVVSALAGSLAIKDRPDALSPALNIHRSGARESVATDAPQEVINTDDEKGGIKMSPSSFDDPTKLGQPKIVLADGSKIYYYDIHPQAQTDDPFIPEPLQNQDGSPVIDAKAETRLIVVTTESGTRYTITEPHNPTAMTQGDRYRLGQQLELGILEEPGGKAFLEQLGYIFVNGQTYAPSPETFKAYCEKAGIDVEIFPDKSYLGPEEYLKAYQEGRYPIGAADKFYSHDIQDDHITALLIGGPDLQKAISTGIDAMLSDPNTNTDQLTSDIDSFTANFRSAILHHGILGEAYGDEQGRSTILEDAKRVGISEEEANRLIRVAQERARSFGLEPKQLR